MEFGQTKFLGLIYNEWYIWHEVIATDKLRTTMLRDGGSFFRRRVVAMVLRL